MGARMCEGCANLLGWQSRTGMLDQSMLVCEICELPGVQTGWIPLPGNERTLKARAEKVATALIESLEAPPSGPEKP